jgi:hypothetical protein
MYFLFPTVMSRPFETIVEKVNLLHHMIVSLRADIERLPEGKVALAANVIEDQSTLLYVFITSEIVSQEIAESHASLLSLRPVSSDEPRPARAPSSVTPE